LYDAVNSSHVYYLYTRVEITHEIKGDVIIGSQEEEEEDRIELMNIEHKK